MEPSELVKTVSRWNQYAPLGNDPDFNRVPHGLRAKLGVLPSLKTPPFCAVKVWPTITNTQGGPRHNEKCQVVGPDNTSPIPRLYVAGELGAIFGHLYWEGHNVNIDCFTKGRIAGRNAAAEKPWG